jgi:hypothetical protein
VQTYTHVLLGACIGASLFPNDLMAQAASVAGATLPDVVQMPKFVLDRARGLQPLAEVPPGILRLKFAFHSIPVWAALSWAMYFVSWPPLLAFALGGLSHTLIDALTHKEPKYWQNDAGFLWPLPFQLARYSGLWEYRIDHGVLRPKPFEAIVCVAALASWSWINLRDWV